jgi:hypothetical protein
MCIEKRFADVFSRNGILKSENFEAYLDFQFDMPKCRFMGHNTIVNLYIICQ